MLLAFCYNRLSTTASPDFTVFPFSLNLLQTCSLYSPIIFHYWRLNTLAFWPLFLLLSLSGVGHSRWFRFRRDRWLKVCNRSSNKLTFKRASRLNINHYPQLLFINLQLFLLFWLQNVFKIRIFEFLSLIYCCMLLYPPWAAFFF